MTDLTISKKEKTVEYIPAIDLLGTKLKIIEEQTICPVCKKEIRSVLRHYECADISVSWNQAEAKV